jgi:nucleotide-binding universal stress UspA family protein
MKNSTILIAISLDTPMSDLAKKFEVIRAIPAHASVLIISEMPIFPYYAVGVAPYGATDIPPEWQREVASHRAALNEKAKEVKVLLQQHGVSGDVTTVGCEPSAVADYIATHAMLSDIVLIDKSLREPKTLFRQAVYGVLFQSPVGILLNDHDAVALDKPKRIFVAWNTHLHSARAVHQALPFLRQAEEVIIGTVDPVMTQFREGEDPGVDVAKWLTHHGCNVVVRQYPSGGQSVGTCILDRAKEAGSDLIVMGSYGHSRTREAFFGGTTRTLIEQTDQPVFLVH